MDFIKTTSILDDIKGRYIKIIPIRHKNSFPRICFVGLGANSVTLDMVARELLLRSITTKVTLIDGEDFTLQKATHESLSDIGPKVMVKGAEIEKIFRNLKVKPIYKELWSQNVKKLLDPQDIIIAFTDVNNMKFFLSKYLSERKSGILITGGVHTYGDGGFIRVYIRDKGRNITPPIEYGFKKGSYYYKIDKNGGSSLEKRELGGENRLNHNRLVVALADEVLQVFCDILNGRLYYDSVEVYFGYSSFETKGGFNLQKSRYFRGEKYEES